MGKKSTGALIMRICSKQIVLQTEDAALSEVLPAERALILNIETTGISAERSRVVLIGCMRRSAGAWDLIQWFDDTGEEERLILSSFLLYASEADALVTYGGDRFDLSFLRKRLAEHDLGTIPEDCLSLDLYKELRPYKKFAGLPDYKQMTVEAYVGTDREDTLEGAEIAKLYNRFLHFGAREAAEQILSHNEADLCGIAHLLPLLRLRQLAEPSLTVRKAQANYYTDHEGVRREEMFLFFRLPAPLPLSVGGMADHCLFRIDDAEGVLKIPIYTETMRYFYANYKDYYFLPEEDMAIHKYIASYVDKSHRLQARPETCYTKKTASFLPEWDLFRTPFFKRAYTDDEIFFEFGTDMKKDRETLSAYASYVLAHILRS